MSSKPLPNIPTTTVLPKLSVEGNAIISSLIRQIIHEENLDDIWLEHILSALSNFGDYIGPPQILSGLKAARVTEIERLSSDRKQRHMEEERLKELKGSRNKGFEKLKGPEVDVMQECASPPRPTTDALKLKEIHDLVLNKSLEFSSDCPSHLVLTVKDKSDATQEPHGAVSVSIRQSCVFVQDEYSFPFYSDDNTQQGDGGVLLFGLENWSSRSDTSFRIVGGTFIFQENSYPVLKERLLSVLRISIYTYISIMLEQHLLENFRAVLNYPEIQYSPTPPTSDVQVSHCPPPEEIVSQSTKPRLRLWKYISKKTGGLLNRITEGPAILGEAFSPRLRDGRFGVISSGMEWITPRSSVDSGNSASQTGVSTQRLLGTGPAVELMENENRLEETRLGPFASTVQKILSGKCTLTTSLNVLFPLPRLIAIISEREEQQKLGSQALSASELSSLSSNSSKAITTSESTTIKLSGIEKTGLGSILGWEGRDARGKGMVGIRGFVRHQGLTVLYSRYGLDGGSKRMCSRPSLVNYRYWSRAIALDAEQDQSVGDFVRHLCNPSAMSEACENVDCGIVNGKHIITWVCSGIKISATVDVFDGQVEKDKIILWQSCKICGVQSEQAEMTDGTYLYSFAKFLELLLWSPIISSPLLCDHIAFSPSSTTSSSVSEPRLCTLWHFAHKTLRCAFSLESVAQSLYTACLPKLQVMNPLVLKEEKRLHDNKKIRDEEQERERLATDIDSWWGGLRNRVDKLNRFLAKEADQAASSKDLPPLPVSDDEDSEYEDEDEKRNHKGAESPSPTGRPAALRSISSQISLGSKQPLWHNLRGFRMIATYPPGPVVSFKESLRMLTQLKQTFDKTEESLRISLQQTPISCLNDVRRIFRSSARGALKRLSVWQTKHAPGAPTNMHEGDAICKEPEWWRDDCHPVPGGRIIVREGESGSIIAFTLSSLDYQRELANLSASHTPFVSPVIHASQPSDAGSELTIKRSKSRPPLDPDGSDPTMWEEGESCSAVVTRKEHPKEPTLLGLREALRAKASFDSNIFSSRFSNSLSRNSGNISPPSAWAPALVQVNFEAADGQVSQFPEAADMVGKTLESRFSSNHALTPSIQDSDGTITPTPSSLVERHISRGGDSTVLAVSSQSSSGQNTEDRLNSPQRAPNPTIPDIIPSLPSDNSTSQTDSSLAGTLSSAMRYFLGNPYPPSRAPSPAPSVLHHKLLAYEPLSTIDDHPHIKYDWTVGQRVKFSCTVYYAKQFDTLRKSCGVDIDIIKSLERSENWATTGGKSKSNFWKSLDDRFIIKTLLNAWNVADLQVLIDLAPSYFRYLDATANKASALAKLMGFYTVEMKNLETGGIQKHDLLVMENLFYKHKVSKTYDLKGIQSRRVKPNSENTDATLFDGEWIDAQRGAPILIHAYSGHILQEALRTDTDFLAKANIMDYSLLLGIDNEQLELSCGLVDAIGSYTFAKTIEYKAKHNLTPNKAKEVTVIPPTEYQARFIRSMENYFLPCPDKWTKPPRFTDRTEVQDLPDIF